MESNLLILLFTLSIVSSQNFSPDNYFINCGSNSNITFTGKTFIGDENLPTLSVSGGRVAVNNNPPSPIYKTARVFTRKSWYELKADKSNTFVMVRLYFSRYFSYEHNLSDSKFDVSVSGFSLLSNFNVGDSLTVKEFIIPIGSKRKFKIEFTPSNNSSAFVNAIEAFTIPYEMFKHDASSSHISPKGYTGEMDDISSSYAFMPIYRINVGGQSIDVERDTLRRNWIPDDPFIVKSEGAKSISFSGTPNYADGSATRYDAPDDVYKTAKQLSANSSVYIVSWNFTVNKNAIYLVRAHFYDFTSQDGLNNAYNLFIYRKYKKEIHPRRKLKSLQAPPFYIDFVVHSAELGFVNVSIGTIPNLSQSALLNGIEIMELLGLHDNRMRNTVVGFVIIGGVIFVLLTCFFIGLNFSKTKPVQETKTESNTVPSHSWSSCTSLNTNLIANGPSQIPKMSLNLRFQFADILQATNNFDESLVIGKGGFGKVYRGALPNGKTVAVKRGEKGHGQGRPEFVKEIMVLSKIQHQHLVTLIGYCDEKSEMILVYEYMENGTLQEHLYGTNKDHTEKLSWSQRLEICIGATEGLHYLHPGSEHGIIHGDVKSTNILLNENNIAKVADFGISRFDDLEESEMGIKGSFGYLDPEYISCVQLTKKSDVYSFGVVLLEVLCARPALDNMLPKGEASLADWAIKQIKNGMVEMIIDPYLVDQIKPNSLNMYLETVERCLKNTGDERPSMNDVLWDLKYVLKHQQLMADEGTLAHSTVNTVSMFSMSMIDRLPSECNDDNSQVNDTSYNDDSQATDTDYPGESQVFSQLKIDEGR